VRGRFARAEGRGAGTALALVIGGLVAVLWTACQHPDAARPAGLPGTAGLVRLAGTPAAQEDLSKQTQADADRKSAGCVTCHTQTDSPTMHVATTAGAWRCGDRPTSHRPRRPTRT
jgi:hypothetical protein